MFWLKGCPWCGGDLFTDTDQFGSFVTCFQCSRELNQADVAALLSRRPRRIRKGLALPQKMQPFA